MSDERKERKIPTEWRVSVPVGDRNRYVHVIVTAEGVGVDYALYSWVELHAAKTSAELGEARQAAMGLEPQP